jgi:hypothetical protein
MRSLVIMLGVYVFDEYQSPSSNCLSREVSGVVDARIVRASRLRSSCLHVRLMHAYSIGSAMV